MHAVTIAPWPQNSSRIRRSISPPWPAMWIISAMRLQKPLDEQEAAKLCGVDERTYAQGAAKLAALKHRRALYNEGGG